MNKLLNVQDRVERGAAWVGIVMLFVLMLFVVASVVARYVFRSPIPASYELTELFIIPCGFLAPAHVQRLRQHIRIDLLSTYFPLRFNWFLDVFAWFLGAAFFFLITQEGGYLAWRAWDMGQYYVGLLEFPLWPAKAGFALGMGLLTLRFISSFVEDLNFSHWKELWLVRVK